MIPRAVLVAAALATLAACSRTEAPPSAPAASPVVKGIGVQPVRVETIGDTTEAVGTVKSRKQTVLSSKIVATVVAVHRREGDHVRAGEVVLELDDRDVRAQLQRAEAGVREARDAAEEADRAIQAAQGAIDAAVAQQELATATLGRYQKLLDRRSVAPSEYDEVSARAKAATAEVARARETKAALLARKAQAASRIDQAQAAVANARVALSWTRIAAPVAGTVVARNAELGTVATPGTPLLTLDEERYRLEVNVPESDVARAHLGQAATATIDALGRDLPATVVEIVPAADPVSRTFVVKLELPAVPGLRSGLYGRARFPGGSRRALLVPAAAVVERGQLLRVFVVDDGGVARLRLVTTGKTDAGRVEVLSGLTEGERVVVTGAERLTDGSRVEVAG